MIYKSQIIQGDVRTSLGTLEDASIDCVVTSPPYYGLRNYGVDGQIGLESTIDEYVDTMVKVFIEVSRVLKPSGTLWLNLGDSYTSGGRKTCDPGVSVLHPAQQKGMVRPEVPNGLKPKDLCGIPWRVAFALQADGWYLRQEIIWSKPNPMPESVKDRCTKAHESIFLLAHAESKGKYYYDADAIREKSETQWNSTQFVTEKRVQRDIGKGFGNLNQGNSAHPDLERSDRNKRSVWNISLKPYSAAHFATFPPELPRTCILAGCPEDGTVLDPFAGAGTTLMVANQLQRHAIGVELNPDYAQLGQDRIYDDAPLFNGIGGLA